MYRRVIKRWIDFSVSFLSIILLGWLFVLIILSFFITNNLPVFFKQERIGFKNASFLLWKFRTLSMNVTLPLSERTFPLGQWLRKTKLDELPQLWNVMKGEMSLVGPRPLPSNYLPRFSANQLKRHNVRPGMTGLAQVAGNRLLFWTDKFRYDCFYVERVSFAFDLIIVARTIKLVFLPGDDYSLLEKEFGIK